MKQSYWSLIILAILFIGIGWYLSRQAHLLAVLQQVSTGFILFLIGSRVLILMTNGLFLRAFVGKFNITLTPTEWVGIPIITSMFNYITPFSGGMVFRATYLKYRYGLPYAQFVMLLSANYLLNFWVVGLTGLTVLLLFIPSAAFYWQLIFFFVAIIIGLPILGFLPIARLPWENRWARSFNMVLEGWREVRTDTVLLLKLVLYSLMNIVLSGLSVWIAYEALGLPISFPVATMIGLLAIFSLLINITPGNLGVQEAFISLSSALFGAGVDEGLLISLLIRAATLACVFTLGPIFSYVLTRKLDLYRRASYENNA
ncbi:MAG: lysylphosphatidylglycerol synthase transmembrane domain-containing protein [Chloroflexota bacterium]